MYCDRHQPHLSEGVASRLPLHSVPAPVWEQPALQVFVKSCRGFFLDNRRVFAYTTPILGGGAWKNYQTITWIT